MAEPILARARGKLHWLCPACNYIHDSAHINWRNPRVTCDGRLYPLKPCNKQYRLGVCFDIAEEGDPEPPFNAILAPPLREPMTNRLGRSALAGEPAIAHLKGMLDFRCALCYNNVTARVDWAGCVTCTTCHVIWRTALIFHPPTPATYKMRMPLDWSVTPENL